VPRESLLLGVAGIFFGILVGWIIGSQLAAPARQATPAPPDAQATQAQAPPPLDESRAAALEAAAKSNPKDAGPRIELGNLYFDHDRFAEATRWYQAALALEPRNVDVSTDLGIAFYYQNQADAALEQFARSLAIDPGHTKTLLNVGIVRAFAKKDLDGAMKVWQRVVDLAPDSPEAQRAREALARLRSAHPEAGSRDAPQVRRQDEPE
jgi:cytochrome c-type biogenesis protein CcmH/NrfG